MNQITNFKTLIGTLYKKLNIARTTGILNVKELYIINIINNLLLDCPNCLNNKARKKLQDLTIELQHLDKDICIYRENRSLYTNILGCKDCNPNNSNIKVINTAPVIIDPDPVDPPVKPDPILLPGCNNVLVQLTEAMDFLIIQEGSFTKCLAELLLEFDKVKITKLPEGGILQYNNIDVIENQIINISDFGIYDLVYTTFLERGNDTYDPIEYQLIIDGIPDQITEVSILNIRIR